MADQPHPHAEEPIEVSQFEDAPRPLTIRYVSGDMVVAYFSEDELDSIASSNAPVSLAFFCLCAGIFGSFLSVLLSTEIKDAMKHATCLMMTVGSGILALFFVYLSYRQFSAAKKKLNGLKKRFGNLPK